MKLLLLLAAILAAASSVTDVLLFAIGLRGRELSAHSRRHRIFLGVGVLGISLILGIVAYEAQISLGADQVSGIPPNSEPNSGSPNIRGTDGGPAIRVGCGPIPLLYKHWFCVIENRSSTLIDGRLFRSPGSYLRLSCSPAKPRSPLPFSVLEGCHINDGDGPRLDSEGRIDFDFINPKEKLTFGISCKEEVNCYLAVRARGVSADRRSPFED